MASRFSILSFALTLIFSGAASGAWINDTGNPEEADYAVLQWPPSIIINAGDTSDTIYGRIYELGVTEAAGANAVVIAEVGYGPAGSDPRISGGWSWFSTTFNVQVGNDDEYEGSFAVATPGNYSYTYRFSLDGGSSWTAADLDGAGSNPGLSFDPNQLGSLTVVPEPSGALLLALVAAPLLRRRAPRGR
jgi:hypothetical protein